MGDWPFLFASAFPFAGGGYGNGVLSKEPILEKSRISLPKGDGMEPRSVAVVETDACVFASVHLDFQSKETQLAQAAEVTDWFQAHYAGYPKPVLLCGDLNALPDSPVLRLLEQNWKLLSGTAPTHSTEKPEHCIDYILALRSAASVEVQEARVLTEGLEEISDHFPVFVRLQY